MQQEIVDRLKSVGLSEDQAKKAITVVTEFIGEKFPMVKGQISNLFGSHETGGKDDKPQVGGINLSGLG